MRAEQPAFLGKFGALLQRQLEARFFKAIPTTVDGCFSFIHNADKSSRYMPNELSSWQKVAIHIAASLQDEAGFIQVAKQIETLSTYERCVTLEVLADPTFGVGANEENSGFARLFQATLGLYTPDQKETGDFTGFVRSSAHFPLAYRIQCGFVLPRKE